MSNIIIPYRFKFQDSITYMARLCSRKFLIMKKLPITSSVMSRYFVLDSSISNQHSLSGSSFNQYVKDIIYALLERTIIFILNL